MVTSVETVNVVEETSAGEAQIGLPPQENIFGLCKELNRETFNMGESLPSIPFRGGYQADIQLCW